MQFNPACLSGNVANNSLTSPEYANNIPTIQHQTFDTSAPQAWSASILNSFPLYGIYNNNLVAPPADAQPALTPPTVSHSITQPVSQHQMHQQMSQQHTMSQSTMPQPTMSQPTPQSQPSASLPQDPKKKPSAKRFPGKDDVLGTIEDNKSQALDEEQRQKRQRRLMKNREAAQQFRHRQKEYIQNLERRVSELNGHVSESHKHIELLTTENRLLRDQLVYLYNVMKQNFSPASSPQSTSQAIFAPTMASPAPLPPAPTAVGLIDLGMLGFKGYEENQFDEGLKHNPSMNQVNFASPPPSVAPSPIGSPITPRIPDMGMLSLSKAGVEDGMNGAALFMARFSRDHNEAQTVPDLIIKSEGSGNM